MTIDIPEGYEALGLALGEAAAQASRGKGADRHAEKGEPFSDQPILEIPRRLGEGGVCAPLYQAVKKIYESRRLPPDRARAELLGAINYLAAAWCLLGGRESVFAPGDADAPRTKEELLKRIRDVNPSICADPGVVPLRKDPASAPEDADMPRFQKWELVEFRSRDGKWRPACFMHMDGGLAVLVSMGARIEVPAFDVRPAEKV